jgi:hypothetical protein
LRDKLEAHVDLPDRLDEWTYETVVSVVVEHVSEPGRFEYKEVLHATKGTDESKGKHIASIRKAACSMANGSGGYILFGVQDGKAAVGAPESRIVGIPCGSELRKEFGEKLTTVERDIYFDVNAIGLPGYPEECVLVVDIPVSQRRPHVDAATGIFWTRGEGGSARPMKYTEVRDQMLYTEGRLQKVTLLRFELATILEVSRMLSNASTSAVRFEAGAFKVLLADIADMLQADRGLLKLLHEIGSTAGMLNPLLDKQEDMRDVLPTSGYPLWQVKADLVNEVREKRAQLFNDCGRAQERLAALFDPLDTF